MSKVSCPYCGSVQVKAMSNQPKKYPRPSDPIALADWQKGYDCKKCGNDFILKPSKSSGCLGLILRAIFWLIIVISLIIFFRSFNKTENTVVEPDSIEKLINDKESQDSDLKYNEGDPTPVAIEYPRNEEFSKEAEEAAHAYIPPIEETQKSIENSSNSDETLSIKTTLREKE